MDKKTSFKKSIFAGLICMIFIMLTLAFVGCDDKYASMTLTLSKTEVTLTLEGGVSSTDQVTATISGDASISRDVVVEKSDNKIQTATAKNTKGETVITVSATDVCQNVVVTVKSLEGSKTSTFVVNVIVPIKNLNATTDESELFVVKGTSKTLSASQLVVFEPSNTTQKDVTFSLVTSTERARINNGVLTVDKNYSNSTIQINAKSEHLGDSGTIIELKVLEALDKDTVLFSSISYEPATEVLYDIDDGTLPTMINMSGNVATKKTIKFVLQIETGEDISIKPIVESTGTYTSNKLSFDSGTMKKYDVAKTEYTVLLNCAEDTVKDKVYFEISYKNYNFSYSTSKITINVQDSVNDIQTYINGTLSSTSNLTVYDKYSGTQGLQLSFEALPTTLSATDRTLVLKLGENADNYYYWKKGQTLALNDSTNNKFNEDNELEIKSGESIYISAKAGNSPVGKITVYSKNNDLIKKEFTIQANYGTTSIKFLNATSEVTELNGDVSYHYYLLSNQENLLTLQFKPDVMDITGLTIDLNGSTISLESQPMLSLDSYIFDVKSVLGAEGTTVVTLNQKNGYYVKAYIHVIYALQEDEIVFSVPSSQTNASVGYMERQTGKAWQFKVAIKKNNSVTLTQEGKGVDSVVYSYFETTDTLSDDYETFFEDADLEGITYNTYCTVIDTACLPLQQIVIKKSGKVIVKATVNGFDLDTDGKLIEKSFVTYFFVEGYVPVENITLSQSVVNLYTQNSVGYEDLALTTAEVKLEFNEDASYGKNITWQNCVLNKTYMAGDKEVYSTTLNTETKTLSITALSTWTLDEDSALIEEDKLSFTFFAVVKEFNTEYRLSLTVNIIKAQQVEKILVENVNVSNGLYIPLVYDEEEITRTIEAVVQIGESGKLPYNTNLIYEFLPSSTLSVSDVSLNRKTGELTISASAQVGGVGTIRIAPADRYNLQNIYEAGENDVAIYISLVIADGQTRDTAYRITKLSDLDNYSSSPLQKSAMHFTLMNDITINTSEDFAIFENFSGGLYGAIYGDTNYATITTNKTLFDTITANACVEDLIVCGNVEGNAFVANTNNGTIQNVTIDAISGEQKQYASPSALNANGEIVGGICATNAGVVDNCLFSGQIDSKNSSANTVVGGIVGLNTKTISNCAVEFYSYATIEDETVKYFYGKITATSGFVGGIVGQMEEDATLTNSYEKSYALTEENLLPTTNCGALVGNFVAGNVDVCFAEIDKIQNLFGQQGEDATIGNAYILFDDAGTQDGTYYVDGTRKTLTDAKNAITTNNIWINESTDAYPTFKNVKAVTPITAIASNFVESDKAISNDCKAVMFYYSINTSLTLQETFVLDDLNFVSFEDLFGKDVYGIRAISSNTQIISTSSTGLNLKGVGEVTITFYSKYNASLTKEYTVYVMNPVSNLTFVAGSVEFGANDILNVKSTQGISFSAVIENTILLDARNLTFEIDQLTLNIEEDFVSGANMGPFSVDTTNLSLAENNVHFNLEKTFTTSDDITKYQYVNDLLKTKFAGLFVLNVYKGADKLDLDTSASSIEPIDYTELKVVVLTDDKDDELLIDLAPNKNYPSDLFQDEDGNYVISEEIEYYEDANCTNTCEEEDAKYFKKTYTITFKIFEEEYKNLNFENAKFYFTINTSSAKYNTETFGTKDLSQLFVLEVSNQQILSVSVAHYENTNKTILRDTSTNSNFVFYKYNTNLADSTIAPGEEGLLKIDLFPTYSKYDYLTVTYQTLNNKDLKMYLSCMEKYLNGFKQSVKSVTDLDNGIKITANSIDDVDNISTIYLGTYIPISIEEDTVFVLTIRAYNNDEIVKETQFNLVVEYTSGAIMNIVDEEGEEVDAASLDSEVILNITIPKSNGMTISEPKIYGCIDADLPDEQIVTKRLQIVEDTFSLTRTYKYSLYIGKNVKTTNDANYVTIETEITWMANGKMQNKSTSITLPIVEFLINDIELSTVREDKTTYYSYIGIESELQFEFDITPDSSIFDSDDNPIDSFLQNCYYESSGLNENSKYIVNYGKEYGTTFLRNLYYVEGSILTPLCNLDGTFNENTYFKFLEQDGNITIVGKRQGEVKLRFVMQTQYPTKLGQTIKEKSFDFTIVVTSYSDEDMPLIIDNENAFWNAVEASTPQNYILMNDLYLEDVSPITTTAIESLDGNNYTIHILSWDTDTTSSALKLALFDTVSETTTLKNLTVNIYHATNISVDTSAVTSLNVAGFAITNNGTIYNCEVVAYKSVDELQTQANPGINITYSEDEEIVSNVAGFVITNNGGYIVNSRVGGTSLEKVNQATQQLEQFNIIAEGNISGFVDTNSGTISSCFFANGTLTNTRSTGTETTTNGFVKTNSGKIVGSYVKGTGDENYSLTGQGITTVGTGAGFVNSNSGTISNCYSNIMLATSSSSLTESDESGRLSAGFVYNNSGTINTCFSASKIENAKNTQMAFVGVDEAGDILNTGEIKYAYYYMDESVDDNVYSNESSDLIITRISDPTDLEKFYGFTFASSSSSVDGVWFATDYGVDLVSANQIAISKRNVANQKYDKVTNELLSYNLPYEQGYEYGSVKNPIIIRSAEEFNLVFGGDDENAGSAISSYYSLSEKYVTGNYRLVCDINLQELNPDSSQDVNISSTQMELRGGIFDGNMMTISGIDLTANTDYISNNFGLFATVTENACIKNLDLSVISISAKKVKYVGTLAGSVENAKLINITVQRQTETSTSSILGNNVVGGLVALVYGDSEIKSIVVDSLSIKANALAVGVNQTYNRASSTSQVSNLLVSYAGSVIGVADCYLATEKNSYAHSTDSSVAQLSYLIAKGEMQVRASTVGGVVGYLGPQTTLRDATFESTDNTKTKIIAYNFYAGGVVGECQGNIDMARAEHSASIQKEIEDNVSTYYHNPSTDVQRGNLTLFEDESDGEVISTYEPIAIGGIVGMLYTGEIQHSYSKVHVINSNVKYAGGVIGQISSHLNSDLSRNEVTLFEVYAFGDVYTGKSGYASGGIVGYIDSGRKISMAKVNAVNYWSVQYNEDISEYELPTNIYQIYAMTNATSDNILALNDIVNANDLSLKGDYSLPTISYTASNNLMYAITDVKFYNKKNVTTSYVQKSYASQVLDTNDVYLMVEDSQKVTPYYDLDNSTTNGFAMNAYFIEAGWDTNYWIRYTKTNDLLPSLVTYSGSMTYYIDEASDLLKMIYHPYATFIVRAQKGIITEDGKHLVQVGDYIESTGIDLSNFSGTLKGYEANQNYGFDFEGKASFISATTNATFKNLAILNLGQYTENVSEYSEINQAFIDKATLTTFEDIYFENCYANSLISADNYNIGIVTNYMVGGSLKNITMQDCAVFGCVNQNDNAPTEINMGIVCGKAETSGSILFQVQDVYVYQDPTSDQPYLSKSTQNCVNLNIVKNIKLDDTTANLGAVIGQTSGSIVTIYSAQNTTSTLTKHIGIACENSKTAYDPMQFIDSVDNYGTSMSIVGEGEIKSANVGVIYGQVSNSIIKTSNSQSLLIVGNIKSSASIDNFNCGGIIGYATSSLSVSGSVNENKYVKVDVDMNIKATNVNAGMIVGSTAQTNTIDNIDTYGQITVSKTSTDNSANIGGYVGETTNNLSISSSVSRTDINYSGATGKLGGLVGNYKTSTLKIGDENYNTKYLGTITIDALTVYVGGLVGSILNNATANINYGVYGGNIKLSKTQSGETEIYAGGLVGSAGDAKLSINNSISYGELNLLTNLSQNTETSTLYLGGLLGIGNGKTTLSNNISASTVASKTAVSMTGVNINALVGDANGAKGTSNFYSHQVSLCLDFNKDIGATNDYYPTLQNVTPMIYETPDTIEECLSNYINTLTTAERKEECPANSKLNPYVIKPDSNWASAKASLEADNKTKLFVVFDRENITDNILDLSSITSMKLDNVQIVGNGTTVKVKNALFSTIDQSSSVSGLKIVPDIESTTSTPDSLSGKSGAGTIANVNNGYIFACTVVSSDIAEYNHYDLKVSGGYGGGLVGVNTGVIMDCMTSINILGNDTTGGLVGYNYKDTKSNVCGVIVSSYSVGKVTNGYAFSSGEGEIYASYTASPADNGVFGSSASVYNSFYDIYAVGCKDKTELTASTNMVAILDNLDGRSTTSLFGTYTNNNLKFSYVLGTNFGYPTFSGSAYSSFTYMQGIDTGDGEDNPIMINSVGKLQQISDASNSTLHYKLISDISTTEDMKTIADGSDYSDDLFDEDFGVVDWAPISDFKGTITGYASADVNYKISNLTTTNSSDWAVFDEVGDNDLESVIENIEFNFGELTISSSEMATIALSITRTTLQNLTIKATSITNAIGSFSGLVGSATNSYIGTDDGGITIDIPSISATQGSVNGLVGSATNSTIGTKKGAITLNINTMSAQSNVNGLVNNISVVTLQNITLNSNTLTSTGNSGSVNGLVGTATGSTIGTSDGDIVINTTSLSGSGSVSGLVGKATSSTIGNASCAITMKVTNLEGSGNVGGLIANTSGSSSTTITNVNFEKDLTIKSTKSGTYAGGLFGNCKDGVDIGSVSLQGVTFNSTSGIIAGGIAGSCSGLDFASNGSINFAGIVTLSTNTNDIVTFGGLVGEGSGDLNLNSTNISISNPISITQSGNGDLIAGGVVGKLNGGNVQLVLNSTLNSANADTTFGGIVGQASNGTITLVNDYTLPTSIDISTSTTNNIGGIVGTLTGGKVTSNDATKTISGTFDLTISDTTTIGAVAGSINNGTVENVKVDGVTLSGLNVGALAGSVSGGTIKNFEVYSSTITGKYKDNKAYVGALASKITNSATLENIKVEDSVTVNVDASGVSTGVTSTTYLGGFTGEFNGTIQGTNEAKVSLSTTGTSYVGGVAGNFSGTISGTITNSGTITSTYIAGGIAGTSSGTISNCTNNATISCEKAETSALTTILAGGIVGEATSNSTISNCTNEATISCEKAEKASQVDLVAGGIAGSATGTISDCENKAEITCGTTVPTDTSTSSSEETPYAGGIAGKFSGTSITSCSNSGTVTAGWASEITTKLTASDFTGIDDESDESREALYQQVVNKVEQVNQEVTGIEQSYAGGICGNTISGSVDGSNSGTITAKAKSKLSDITKYRFNPSAWSINGYDSWCYYVKETTNAYATGITYNTGLGNISGSNEGVISGGGLIEFNIYAEDDEWFSANVYESYILDYGYSDGALWSGFETLYKDNDNAYEAWTKAKEDEDVNVVGIYSLSMNEVYSYNGKTFIPHYNSDNQISYYTINDGSNIMYRYRQEILPTGTRIYENQIVSATTYPIIEGDYAKIYMVDNSLNLTVINAPIDDNGNFEFNYNNQTVTQNVSNIKGIVISLNFTLNKDVNNQTIILGTTDTEIYSYSEYNKKDDKFYSCVLNGTSLVKGQLKLVNLSVKP